MAYIAHRQASNYGNTITVDIPSEAAAGDKLALLFSIRTQGTPTGLGALTKHRDGDVDGATNSGGKLWVYDVDATTGGSFDPGTTLNIGISSNAFWSAAVVACDAGDVVAFDDAMANGGGGVSAVPTPALLGVESAGVILHIAGGISSSSSGVASPPLSSTPPGSTTERVDTSYPTGVGQRVSFLTIATETLAAPGNTTARTFTPSENVQGIGAQLVIGSSVTRPVANAGTDQDVLSGVTVNLNGTPSDGGGAGAPYTYQWTQLSGPAVTLSDDTAEDPTFTAPATTSTVVLQLVVTDTAAVDSLPDTVTINVTGPEDTALPISDITVTGWTPSTGTTVFPLLADSNDSTFATSPEDPAAHPLRVGLAPISESTTGDIVTLSARVSRQNASSASAELSLIEGASTVIATTGSVAIAAGSVQQIDLVLDDAEITSIGDESNLRAHLDVTAVD